MTKTILITGATAGFGRATAEHFATAGWNCIITGRRADRLTELATELKNKFAVEIYTLCFDVQNREDVFTAINSLPTEWQSIDVLLNNAGLALGRDSFELANLDDWDTMINTNVKGLMYVTKAVLPFMIAHKKGHIINIGSTAGKEVYKDGNGYCASKHAVDAISKAMRIDLLPHQIKVTAIHPGAAETEFSLVRFKGDDQKANAVYDGYKALEAKDIAEIVYYVSTLPAHVCINDLVVTCLSQANSFYLHK
ncbi:MAG: NAD(P)-dependent oxidoreductase [Sphingobacteriia bacterium 24-36-13]|jgi:NADP-dependent 3-hydroxy acid dehydrogenase YdfG|uniref:SDR family NAD(P)-dependent oxidoreductase n=1 Tax=Sediminibacterium sp. TaxID=1917865 RepID=UPI000BD5BF62|nr:SDR family NAD(P)-dependent oxidoreductase [Sediminibacterium sp.]OYY12013.1 MAG: NAD(P)-dependent oxidoreductase [Sphingobacteriia bacterium 35-36-14]OYZ55051.1 MAG: NAD(P)-dependent oxidoreductase [Sphingobacteriia bacterium 24-36-13]OZA66421.1 MAG: NAD(P)-dependent oxidoreductase [Sphingobacteriia bacterium 39-36-14]HQS23007.1 SDR family NAD(P)-dependent oxidoreductase [Sediminibacterium sp.]HQS33803.1 SDR family NAD(P)-dependent oxidoreductase [Sediminibacterium sp.]